jgi:hypothetical protein
MMLPEMETRELAHLHLDCSPTDCRYSRNGGDQGGYGVPACQSGRCRRGGESVFGERLADAMDNSLV